MAEDGKGGDGVVRRALYCDESGISGDHSYYGFGILVMPYQRRGEFVAAVEKLRRDHNGTSDEIKWSKTGKRNQAFYDALIDYFFEENVLAFHCMVVERAWVKTQVYHNGSFDKARQKHFTQLLSNKITRIKRLCRGRDTEIRVYVDRLPSAYTKAAETVGIIANRMVDKLTPLGDFAEEMRAIDSLTECESHDYLGVQLSDLLLGAVVDTWNQKATSAPKVALQKKIAGYLGWHDLRSDTRPSERKFNIWRLTDQFHDGEERPVKTRPVKLRIPLPAMRGR